MTNDDSTDDSQTRLSRRDWLSVTGAAVGTAMVGSSATDDASAQTGNEPRINLGDNFYIDDIDGETLAITDASNGSTVLEYDSTAGGWTLPAVSTGELSFNLANGEDLTSDRQLENTYQNTTGHIKFIQVVLVNETGSTGEIDVSLNVSDSQSGTTDFTNSIDQYKDDTSDNALISVEGIVPDGGHYQLISNGIETLNLWRERGYV